ncbi:MAG: amidohydrolase family protein [Chitinophagaceae bacterium]|jgi:imidazolonepropionase-like amidohydrolase|nr:amidohydrolase family protein [Chitinophagaceae bacterium]
MKNFLYILFLLPSIVQAQTAIKAETIYPATGPAIRNGIILIKDGKIEKVGTDVQVPPGYQVMEAKAVTPGLVDARSVVGFSGALNIPTDQDQVEKSSPLQPDLRAVDAYNPDEKLVDYVRQWGVTTLHTGHGMGALISGQTMVVKTKPGTADAVVLIPEAMLAMTLGEGVSGFQSPGTRAKQVAMLRTELLKAQSHAKKMTDKDTSKRPAPDLKMDMLVKLLKGEVKGLIYANKTNDMMNAIRLSKEFGFKLVLEGAAEAYRITDEIKAAKAEIILHATMARNGDDMVNMTRESAALLTAAGIPVSIETGYEAYVPKTRVLLHEAAQAMAHGLNYEEAIKTITLHPAKLLGLEKRIGSIEEGKDADLVLYNGDPFEYLTKVCFVMIEGQIVSRGCE